MQKCWQNVLRVWYCYNSIRVRLLGVLPETERGEAYTTRDLRKLGNQLNMEPGIVGRLIAAGAAARG